MKFICIKTCQRVSLIHEGDTITVSKDSDIHSSVRPFFTEANEDGSPKDPMKIPMKEAPFVEDRVEASEDDTLKTLHEKADKIGVGFDRRWPKSKVIFAINQKLKGM